ncbi:MAG: hypothetical protein CM15mV24_0370 [Bellamyvirus sp.]|nr:MAG: hypothetical protein CM15mV24_0370 [Bellamyvirus sp.]
MRLEDIGTKKSAGLAQSISRSSRPSSTAAYQQQMQSQQNQQSQSGYSDEKVGKAVPEINADQMVSAQKYRFLDRNLNGNTRITRSRLRSIGWTCKRCCKEVLPQILSKAREKNKSNHR